MALVWLGYKSHLIKQHTKSVGIIGLGIMGSIIARASVVAGHEVVGYDPMPAARARLRRSGGRALASGIEVAMHADTLICSLPSTAALHAVVADLQQAGRPKAEQIVIETSTSPLADKLAAAAALRKQGRQMVDAPISGTATPAPQQNWIICLIPFPYHPCTLSASLAVRLYCRRFAFAFTNDLEME